MTLKKKTKGPTLQMVTQTGTSGTYLFLKDPSGSYHALVEVNTKDALRDCGAEVGGLLVRWRASS